MSYDEKKGPATPGGPTAEDPAKKLEELRLAHAEEEKKLKELRDQAAALQDKVMRQQQRTYEAYVTFNQTNNNFLVSVIRNQQEKLKELSPDNTLTPSPAKKSTKTKRTVKNRSPAKGKLKKVKEEEEDDSDDE